MFSSFLANSNATNVAAPDDIPARIPSCLARASNVDAASWSFTVKISSIASPWKVSGTKPAPIPWILWAPGVPFDKTGEVSGSTATAFKLGLTSLIASEIPVIVPPVPTPATTISTLPSVSLKISCAVVFLWNLGLAWFTNCPGLIEFGISSNNSFAFLIAHRK